LIHYIVDIKNDDNLLDQYKKCLSTYKQERIKKLAVTARRITINQIIIGELLLKYILLKHYQILPDKIIIREAVGGKPYLANYALNFNISHSGSKVMCSCDKEPIGVDIQEIKEDMQIDPWLFSAREAYGKFCGYGLDYEKLPMIKKCVCGKHFVKVINKNKSSLVYQQLYMSKYVVSISSRSLLASRTEIKICEVKYNKVLNKIKCD